MTCFFSDREQTDTSFFFFFFFFFDLPPPTPELSSVETRDDRKNTKY